MAVLLSIGLAIIYGLKVNLSIAIVSMVNNTALEMMKVKTNVTAVHDESCEPSPLNDTEYEVRI